LPQPASDDEAIRQLIQLEGQMVVAQDIAGLMDLWAPDAVVTDARHTPANLDDDARWRGRDAIRERYVVLVFPGNPTSAGATDIQITIEGDTATATSTTVIGGEVSPGGDRWTFAKRDGRWWITGLTYNLEAK
jgi:ketosteroid isomerase-like protein